MNTPSFLVTNSPHQSSNSETKNSQFFQYINANDKIRVCSIIAIGIITTLHLSSCTMGVGMAGSELIGRVSHRISSGPLDHLPSDQLKAWAARPGPELTIEENRAVSSQWLIKDADVVSWQPASGPKLRLGDGLCAFTTGVANLLALSDAFTIIAERELYGLTESQVFNPFDGPDRETRRQLVLREAPFVILHGEHVYYRREGKSGPVTAALAMRRAKITVITPEGSYFALANRIHIRSGVKEIILEGDPMVQTGHQHIRAAKPDELMTLDVQTRKVLCSGSAVLTRLYGPS